MKNSNHPFIPCKSTLFSDRKKTIIASTNIPNTINRNNNYPADFYTQNFLIDQARTSEGFRQNLINSHIFNTPLPILSLKSRENSERKILKPFKSDNISKSFHSSFQKQAPILKPDLNSISILNNHENLIYNNIFIPSRESSIFNEKGQLSIKNPIKLHNKEENLIKLDFKGQRNDFDLCDNSSNKTNEFIPRQAIRFKDPCLQSSAYDGNLNFFDKLEDLDQENQKYWKEKIIKESDIDSLFSNCDRKMFRGNIQIDKIFANKSGFDSSDIFS